MLLSSVFPRTGLSVDSVTCSLNSILCSGWNVVEELCTFVFRFTLTRMNPSGGTALWMLLHSPGQTSQTTFLGTAGATPHASGSRPPFVLMTTWITIVLLLIDHHIGGHHLLVCIVMLSTGVNFVRFVHLIVIGTTTKTDCTCSKTCTYNVANITHFQLRDAFMGNTIGRTKTVHPAH